MGSTLSATYKDNAGQKATVRFRTRDIIGANLEDIETEFSALRAALEPYTLGNLQDFSVGIDTAVSDGAAANAAARRELKFLLVLEDAVTHDIYQHEVPCPELTNASLWVNSGGRTFAVESGAEWTALKTALETTVRSKAGNSVILREIEIVGRNL